MAASYLEIYADLDPALRALLRRLAWLAPAPVPVFLFEHSHTSRAVCDPAPSLALLAALEPHGLLTWNEDRSAFSLDPLFQPLARGDETPAPAETAPASLLEALRWLANAAPLSPGDDQTWHRWTPLVPHVAQLTEHGMSRGIAQPTGLLLNQVGIHLEAKSDYASAEVHFRNALAIAEYTTGPEHSALSTRLNNLAALLQHTNRFAEAEPLMRRAVAIDEERLGPDHPHVAIDLSNLASLLLDTNRYEEAEPLLRRTLALDERHYGPEHPHTATDLNNLAQALQPAKRFAEAEPLMRRALTIVEKSFGSHHPRFAIDLNNLAQLLHATNRLAEAEPLLRRVVEIFVAFTEATGHQHPHLQQAIGNYHGLLSAMGLKEAEVVRRVKEVLRPILEKEGEAP